MRLVLSIGILQIHVILIVATAVGVLGLRQVGKSTLLRDRLEIPNYLTFDDSELRREAEASLRVFLSKHQEGGPTVLDEVQKVPDLNWYSGIPHRPHRPSSSLSNVVG